MDVSIIISRVCDGDTFVCDKVVLECGFGIKVLLEKQRFRLPRIQADELNDPNGRGREAKEYLEEMIERAGGSAVLRDFTNRKEKWGRWLTEVWIGGRNASDSLMDAGLARLMVCQGEEEGDE